MNAAPANFWQFAWWVACWIEAHFTRGLGVLSGTLGILGASNVIPSKYIPYCMVGVSILTYWRGQAISDRVDAANTILAYKPPAPLAKDDIR